MRAATYTQGGVFAICDVPEPEAGPCELLLRIRATALCGTDFKIVKNGHRKLAAGQRIVLGHELVGDVVQAGAGVTGFRVGQRVGVVPNAGCGHCRSCRRGEANYCNDYTAFGIDRDGAHAPLMKVPSSFIEQGNVHPLPPGVSDEAAALLEPLSCVVNARRAVDLKAGEAVVIYGAGPMGLLHVMACREAGAGRIVVVDPRGERHEPALALGADRVLPSDPQDVATVVGELTGGEGADVAITACPVRAAQEQALALLAVHGRLCLFGGLPADQLPLRLDANAVHYRGLVVTGTTGGSVSDYREALRLVETGRIDPTQVVSDVLGLNNMDRAYRIGIKGAQGKILLVADK